jgi:phosphatidylglycerophosphatase C
MLAEKTITSEELHAAKRQLVLLDFDGTITMRDTLAEFMIHYHGKWKYYLGLGILLPIIFLYLTRLIENWKAKQYFLSWFLRGTGSEEFRQKCASFARFVVPSLVRPGVLDEIEWHKNNGATIAVVSASAQDWVKPWCDKYNLICLATRLEVKDNKITGKILGKNCHGSEKVCRIKEAFKLEEFHEIIAYGDSAGDKEMLALAHEKHYKPFRT